jgi:hypothetical protein
MLIGQCGIALEWIALWTEGNICLRVCLWRTDCGGRRSSVRTSRMQPHVTASMLSSRRTGRPARPALGVAPSVANERPRQAPRTCEGGDVHSSSRVQHDAWSNSRSLRPPKLTLSTQTAHGASVDGARLKARRQTPRAAARCTCTPSPSSRSASSLLATLLRAGT